MNSDAGERTQAAWINHIDQPPRAADEAALAQMAQHPGQGFGRDPELRRNRTLALLQLHRHQAFVASLCVTQQPLGAARLGILGQTADGKLRLLTMRHRHIVQNRLR